MKRQNIPEIIGIGLLALGLGAAAAPALAQEHYPSARKLDDNGSVSEPGPAPGNTAAVRRPVRRRRLVNYQGQRPQQPAPHQYYSSARRADDNGSVDEPGPGR